MKNGLHYSNIFYVPPLFVLRLYPFIFLKNKFPLFLLLMGIFAQISFKSPAIAQSQLLFPPVVSEENLPLLRQDNSQDNYTLESGDVIRLEIFQLPQYDREYRILSDGTLSLPLVGSIYIEGLTISQARNEILTLYSRIIQRPSIDIDLVSSAPLNVVVAGEVNRPGAYQVVPMSQGGRPTLTQAIGLAEGITQHADIRNIRVSRKSSSNEDGSSLASQSVNLWNLIRTGSAIEDLPLRNGDSIFIPTAETLAPSELVEMASSNFSPQTIDIYVVGEVPSPGLIELPPNVSLNQAILAAGGFTRRSNINSVDLIRLNPDGSVSTRRVVIDFTQGLTSDSNPLLLPNDTVIVRPSNFTQVTDSLGVLLQPINTGLFFLDFLFD